MLRSSYIVGLSAGSIGLALALSTSAVAAPYTAWQQPYSDGNTNVMLLLHMDETSGTNANNTGGLGGLPDGTYPSDASNNVASGAGIPASGFGRAFNATGSNSISVPSDPSMVGPFSDGYVVEAWINADTLPADGTAGEIVSKYDHTTATPYPGGRQFRLYLNHDGTIGFTSARSDGLIYTLTTTAKINTGEWHHVAWQYDTNSTFNGGSNRWELYIDGVMDASQTFGAWGYTTDATPVRIGAYMGTSDFFDGKIDEVRLSTGQYQFAVPEPASLSLLALGGLMMVRRRK